MPIYEYHCETCGERFETMQRLSDPPLETCGALCRDRGDGGGRVRRLMSVSNVGASGRGSGAGYEAGPPECGRCEHRGSGCQGDGAY
ncbi:zinc ribbon domain-containing protein [Myxococcota bacterium]|nr:zinc ribbon domain-containing protein [Myxococcota bacterium]